MTAQIVSAHVSRNALPVDKLPELIQAVFTTLSQVGVVPAPEAKPEPAVPIKKSVFADYIVCFEDGKKLKMLKRHLAASYGLTPRQYRDRWDLPANYPMVAPTYAAQRSVLAKDYGLGRKRRVAEVEPAYVVPEVPASPRKGRRKPKSKVAA